MRKNVGYVILAIVAVLILIFFIDLVRGNKHVEFTVDEEINEPVVGKHDAVYGNENGSVTIVQFGYVGCRNCADMQAALREIADGNDAVRLVWKDYPNTSLAPDSLSAAVAGRCAQEQGAFWEFQPYLFGNADRLGEDFYLSLADDLDLKGRKFKKCLEKGRGGELVQASIEEGNALSITAAPTLFVNGERYTGGMTPYQLQNLIPE